MAESMLFNTTSMFNRIEQRNLLNIEHLSQILIKKLFYKKIFL